MFSAQTVLFVIFIYMGVLFFIARRVERIWKKKENPANHPVVYSLAAAVYCTAWTFYGTVGEAAVSGFMYLTIPLGPTLCFCLSWIIIRRMVRIKSAQRITSIADFISARYGKSQSLAILVTLISLIIIAPYIALQIRAVTASFRIIADSAGSASGFITACIGPVIAAVMIAFTNLFGIRRIEPAERHPALVYIIAVQSVVKLAAFLCVGVFVTYYINDGFGDLFRKIAESGETAMMSGAPRTPDDPVRWFTRLVLSMSAVLFLPRQFHVTVVENYNENHIRTAAWLFPLYLLLISLFTFPIAMTGLQAGLPADRADSFSLLLPFHFRHRWLSLFVFIGGFSAAAGMIMVSAVTLSNMLTNHLLFPFIGRFQMLSPLRSGLLKFRWAAAALVILTGYGVEILLRNTSMLLNIGLISFSAALQFAPAILGGLFWETGRKRGAQLGLSAGFAVWCYTLLMPAVIRNGWLPLSILEAGPWGMGFLRPEGLLGLDILDPLSHGVFWSMIANVGGYLAGSVYFRRSREETSLARAFTGIMELPPLSTDLAGHKPEIEIVDKIPVIEALLNQYYPIDHAACQVEKAIHRSGVSGKSRISIVELGALFREVEKILTGAIGAATARGVIRNAGIISEAEAGDLSAVYGRMLADMNITPEDLHRKIAYYREREGMQIHHAEELQAMIREKEKEIRRREKMEDELRKSEKKYRDLFESAPDGIVIVNLWGTVLSCNPSFIRMFRLPDRFLAEPFKIRPLLASPETDRRPLLKLLKENRHISSFRMDLKDGAGRVFPASLSIRPIQYEKHPCVLLIVRDVTRLRQMEAELREYADRLEQMVAEKTRELRNANAELSAAVISLEDAQEELALSARKAGMAEMAVSILHNIGNAINSVNVRTADMGRHLPEREVRSLEKIYDHLDTLLIRSGETAPFPPETGRVAAFLKLTIDLLRQKHHKIKDDLAFISKGLDHVIEIIAIQQKYAGMRGQESRVSLNDLIRDAEEMLDHSLKKRKIRMEFRLEPLPDLYVDKNKMVQNLINLIKNAYESIDLAPEKTEKRITVRTGLEAVPEDGGGGFAVLEVEDTGAGVTEADRSRIFRFNFSTKGRQSGFGLHDTANHIKALGGDIGIESEGPGKGARVRIRIPLPVPAEEGAV